MSSPVPTAPGKRRSDADLAVQRVAERVRQGGHNVPEGEIRRKYSSGLKNLRELYLPHVDAWRIYDGERTLLRLVAEQRGIQIEVGDPAASTEILNASHE
jgi:predicted ABC-type ATPase